MNYVYNKQLLVDKIFGNDHKYEWQAVIDKYSSLRNWISVGESVTSNEFCLIFPNSIGESKWKLLFYPNGQYVNEKVNTHAGIYLILLSCENKDIPLTANITFRLKPVNDVQHDGHFTRLNTEFVHSDPFKRWIGKPEFIGKKWLSSKRFSDFFVNDTLVIQCTIEVAPLKDYPIKIEKTQVNNEETNKKKGNIRQEELTCSDDDFESKHPDWTEVYYNKKKGNQGKKQNNNNNAPKPKNNNQQKRKNKSNKGGKKKKK